MSDNRARQRAVQAARRKWQGNPAGTRVRFWPGMREGEGKISVTTSELHLLGGHTWGVYIEGAGFIAATHADPIDDEVSP